MALAFKVELSKPRSLDELHSLWRETNYPYAINSCDPYSDDYKQEVTSLYQGLTGSPYTVSCELTSTLQTPENFRVGYPWISRNLRVVASELGKAVHAIRVMHEHSSSARSFIEFGAGWGNLAVALARAGMDVTAIDIDPGFLDRLTQEAQFCGSEIQCVNADFLEAIPLLSGKRYDCVIFCSSFHHCLDFAQLLQAIRDTVLSPCGAIYFFAEPVDPNLAFPWGIRYDGESIWAVTCNKWMELGFSEIFFRSLFPALGLRIEEIAASPGLAGRAWVARRQ